MAFSADAGYHLFATLLRQDLVLGHGLLPRPPPVLGRELLLGLARLFGSLARELTKVDLFFPRKDDPVAPRRIFRLISHPYRSHAVLTADRREPPRRSRYVDYIGIHRRF
jgi:hypothetical protein